MLDSRKGAILRAIVREFVRAGQPVGSRALTEKLGLAVSETGTSATSAIGAKNAMGFAVKQINDKGGIDGAKIEVVTRDIGSTAAAWQSPARGTPTAWPTSASRKT